MFEGIKKDVECISSLREGNLMEERVARSQKDRRVGVDRRKFDDPNYKGPERRSGKDRRSGVERRKSS